MTVRDAFARFTPWSVGADAIHGSGAWYWMSAVVLFLLGCGGAMTSIVPTTVERANATARACSNLFPRGGFESTSIVEATIPFSDDASLLAVVTSPSDQSEFRSVMLSQEGMVLFDATRRGERIMVHRALPPLDPKGFGRRMTDDIRLMSFRPGRESPEVGVTDRGVPICRWSDRERTVDVLLTGATTAHVTETRAGRKVREAWLKEIDADGRAREILLENTGLAGYRLRIVLQRFESK